MKEVRSGVTTSGKPAENFLAYPFAEPRSACALAGGGRENEMAVVGHGTELALVR